MTQLKTNPGLFKRNPPIAGEAEAIDAAKNGDAEAFSKLYALHKRRVYTLCLRMLGNVSEAEDMTQEAFPASLSQAWQLSRGVCLLYLAAPPYRQPRPDASAQERPQPRFS